MTKKIFIKFILLFCIKKLEAQNVTVAGLFPAVDLSGELSSRLSYNVFLFGVLKPYSSREGASRLLFMNTEAGLSYKITRNLSFTNSYVYELNQTFGPTPRNEHRLFQQLTLQMPINKSTIKHRLRFDERWIENTEIGRYEFSHRIRYLLGINQPLNEQWYLWSFAEVFFNTTIGENLRFEERWITTQLGYNLNQNNAIQLGYLFVGWVRDIQNNQKIWYNQHYLQATFISKLNFNKHKNN